MGGVTKTSLASKYGVHRKTVDAHIRRAKAARPPKVTQQVLAQYAEGVSATVVARQCGVGADSVVRHARLAGTEAGSHRCPPEQVDQIVAAYAEGEGIVDIGQKFGMGHRRVRQVLVDAGSRSDHADTDRPWRDGWMRSWHFDARDCPSSGSAHN